MRTPASYGITQIVIPGNAEQKSSTFTKESRSKGSAESDASGYSISREGFGKKIATDMKDPRTTFSSSEWSMILASYDVSVGSTSEPEVASGGFDSDFYLATYADVATGVSKGFYSDAREHYDEHGEYEDRSPYYTGESNDFDEVFYLEEHSDVADMVADGEYRSGAHHFWEVGRKEGRKKNPTNEDSMKPIDLDKKGNMSDDEIYAQSLRNSLLQANPKGRLQKPEVFKAVQKHGVFGEMKRVMKSEE